MAFTILHDLYLITQHFGLFNSLDIPFLWAMASPMTYEIGMNIALSVLPIPPATRHQSLIYLAHIGKIFYCLLQETLKNQADDTPEVDYEHVSEAFHKSLFDLQLLTHAFLEGQYVPAARAMVLSSSASTPHEDELFRFALQSVHSLYPTIKKDTCQATAQWLLNEHGPFLVAESFDLDPLLKAFGLRLPVV